MSFTGKLKRGYKWYSQRNRDGDLPKGIAEDPEKLRDVEFYKEFVKDEDENKVNTLIAKIRNIERSAGRKKRMSEKKRLLKELENLKSKPKKKKSDK